MKLKGACVGLACLGLLVLGALALPEIFGGGEASVQTGGVAGPAKGGPETEQVIVGKNVRSPVVLKRVMTPERSAGVRSGWRRYCEGEHEAELAIQKALRWLKATQDADGSWSVKPEYGLTKGMDRTAAAGLAVLTFLSHGETPSGKEFGPTVEKAIDYLVSGVYVETDADGTPRKDVNGCTPSVRMREAWGTEYGFLIATYALCEAYAMTRNWNVRVVAEQCLARIIRGQTATGGWNYNLSWTTAERPDDLSFGSWALLALKAGQMASLSMPGGDACIKKAVRGIRKRHHSERAGFVYRAGDAAANDGGGLAGAGCLPLLLFGQANAPEVAHALDVMRDWTPSLDATFAITPGGELDNPQYYCFYATRCKYLAGNREGAKPKDYDTWKKWRVAMYARYTPAQITVVDAVDGRPVLVKDHGGRDCEMGRWENHDRYSFDVMSTCLVALQLTTLYRYLPTTTRRAADASPPPAEPPATDVKVSAEL